MIVLGKPEDIPGYDTRVSGRLSAKRLSVYFVLLLVGTVAAFALFASPTKADIDTGLVGRWKLDEGTGTTTADTSGNGNNGTIVRGTGTGSPAWVSPGHDGTGAALEFDGTGLPAVAANTVNVGNSATLDQLDNYTISVWVKFEPGYVGNGGGEFANLVGRNSSGPDWAWMIYVRSNGRIRPHHRNSDGTFAPLTDSATVLPTGEWVHIEQVADNGELFLYIDGQLDANFPIPYSGTTMSLSNADTYIGQDARGGPAPLATISEVSIYNKARTAPGGVSSHLQLWMRADSGVNGTTPVSSWEDESGHGNNGGATGDPNLANGAVNFNNTISFDGTEDSFGTNLDINPAIYTDLAVFSVYKPSADPAGAVWGSDNGSWDRLYGQLGSCTGTSDGTGCVTVPDSFSTNEWKISSVIFDEDTANGSSAYVNGALETAFTSDHGPEPNANFKIGQVGDDSSYFNGDIAEVIAYTQLLDSDTDRQQIESYLATRYGITLGDTSAPIDYLASDGTAFWTGDATYQNDVAGIGRDDTSSLDQRQSKSENPGALVAMGNGTIAADDDSNPNSFASDLSFMMWGNDGASTNTSAVVDSTPLARMERIWTVQETGTVDTVLLRIPQSALAGTSPTLLVSDDATFDSTDQQITLTANGSDYDTNVNLNDGQFFTFAIASTTPDATTDPATNITATSATLGGTLNTLGHFTSADVFFRYRVAGSGDPFIETTPQTLNAPGPFNANISGLDPSTQYEFLAVVQWQNGGTQEAEGSLTTFTTFPEGTQCTENFVDCFVNPITGKNVVLEVDEACTINATAIKPEADLNISDPGFEYPIGLMEFVVDCGTPGYTTTVNQHYFDTTNDGYVLRKHNPNMEAYFTIAGATIEQTTLDGQTVTIATFQATDGGELDIDGQANGTIVDPSGLALSPGDSGLANTGQNMWIPASIAALIVATGLAVMRRSRTIGSLRS